MSSALRKIKRSAPQGRSDRKAIKAFKDEYVFLRDYILFHGREAALRLVYSPEWNPRVGTRGEWSRWVRGSKTTFKVRSKAAR